MIEQRAGGIQGICFTFTLMHRVRRLRLTFLSVGSASNIHWMDDRAKERPCELAGSTDATERRHFDSSLSLLYVELLISSHVCVYLCTCLITCVSMWNSRVEISLKYVFVFASIDGHSASAISVQNSSTRFSSDQVKTFSFVPEALLVEYLTLTSVCGDQESGRLRLSLRVVRVNTFFEAQ